MKYESTGFLAFLTRKPTEEQRKEGQRMKLFLLKKRLMMKYKGINIGELKIPYKSR